MISFKKELKKNNIILNIELIYLHVFKKINDVSRETSLGKNKIAYKSNILFKLQLIFMIVQFILSLIKKNLNLILLKFLNILK